MLFANVCAGFINSCQGFQGNVVFFWLFDYSLEPCAYGGVLAWPVYLFMCTGAGLRRCAFRWTRPLGGGRWRHDFRNLRGVCWAARKTASYFCGSGSNSIGSEPCMLALAGQPSLHGYNACMVYWVKRALWRDCRQRGCETSFSPKWFFCLVGIQGYGSGVWHTGTGRARNPGPVSHHFAVEVFNVGGWLTHGDLALEAQVDFVVVVEHGLIPARVRSEWARIRGKGLASIWAPACQDTSHVGHAGVGVVSLRGAPVALPTFCHSPVWEVL